MASVKDHFLDLERHRRQLEENVEKLRKAITHWRMCDADYEELKEEVEAISGPADRADLDRICDEFEGQVINVKEVKEIFGEQTVKSKAQIVNILSRRIDYVAKNVETLEKQLQAAEEKYEKANIVVNPDVMDEDSGLPITDIIEELDDDDNITASRLQRPGDSTSAIREALEKAGVKDLPETNERVQADVEELSDDEDTPMKDEHNGRIEDAQKQGRPQSETASTIMEIDSTDPPAKKGVSFAEDTKPGHDLNGRDQQSRTRDHLEQIMRQAKEQEAPISNPVIPEGESDDDAELRREMLRYGMTDIAPIVAELEIDEGTGSEFDDDEYSLDEDDGFEDDEDEDEDEHGRTKSRVVDDKYRKRMQELEERLGIKSSRQIDEEEEAKAAGSIPEEGIARIAIQPAASSQPAPTSQPAKSSMKGGNEDAQEPKPVKKGVKFANALDIAPEADATPALAPAEPKEPYVDPMRSTIVERSPAAQPAAPTASAPKKASRFKKARATEPASSPAETQLPVRTKGPAEAPARFLDQEIRTAPTGPDGKTLAGTIVERDMPSGAVEPDEFDATLLHQEAAVEYHRMRNRMMQKQGGFVAEKEEAIEYPEDEETGGKRVSRFKAARLGRQ
ncbi:hypothetical protein INS49_002341 [Diaporthe citri]|uniref:uncharacterized protein n=1 Tax=Diaporthe citri TaxID=83186 RepID=UPI001C7EC538|nr:uncharacterized protein INS49_002341 [Diaporthe citri]KAG6368140.1 hypothetical protein INS49_002341 [Diaporthe citri]